MKRVISLLITAVLIVVIFVPALASTGEEQYDADESIPYFDNSEEDDDSLSDQGNDIDDDNEASDEQTDGHEDTDFPELPDAEIMFDEKGFEGAIITIAEFSADLTPRYGSNGKFIAPIDPPVAESMPVSTRAELEAIGTNSITMSGNYHLTNDIDLSGAEWVPIEGFRGIFDGQGYVIRNMRITGNDYTYDGLFGRIYDAVIKNAGLEGTYIDTSDSLATGGICGNPDDYMATSSIVNCYNSGEVKSVNSQSVGGISGYAPSFISYCYNTADVSGDSSTSGGICGYTYASPSINDCFNTGNVVVSNSSSWATAGGIIGDARNSVISNCYNAGSVTAYSSSSVGLAGGICGSGGSISKCYNTGDIASSCAMGGDAGGICGRGSISISSCYNTGNISASSATNDSVSNNFRAGGICGYAPSSITNCYNTGNVSSSAYYYSFAGGICGANDNPANIGNCYSTGAVASSAVYGTYAGGICGANSYPVLNCYWNSDSAQTVNGSPQIPKVGMGGEAGITTPLTTAQMKNAVNFIGFDFAEIWGINPAANDGYPFLRELTDEASLPPPPQPKFVLHLPEFDYDPNEYNQDLALDCATYSMLAYDDYHSYNSVHPGVIADYYVGERTYNPTHLQNMLRHRDYKDITTQNYNDIFPHNISFTLAKKDISHNGEPRTLVLVVLRGTDGVEWQGNMDIAAPGSTNYARDNHYSFESAAESLELRLYLYLREIEDALLMVTGHSRGAAVANLLAYNIGNGVYNMNGKIDTDKVYAYTFATPNCTRYPDKDAAYIFNFCFDDDFVPQVPLEDAWGYGKHGRTSDSIAAEKLYSSNSSFKSAMNSFVERSKDRNWGDTADFFHKGTKDLIDYIGGKWNSPERYYNRISKIEDISLYTFMRGSVAPAAMDDFAAKLRLGTYMVGPDFKNIARFFVRGVKVKNYINDTHQAFTYYTAVRLKLFGDPPQWTASTGGGRGSFSMMPSNAQLQTSAAPANPNPDEIAALTSFAQQDGNIQNLSWNLSDAATWSGVVWGEGAENRVTEIDISYKDLTGELDVSGFSELLTLDCRGNYIETIIADDCVNLETLDCTYNNAVTLSIDNCNALQTLNCGWNMLDELNVSGFTALTELHCGSNLLASLDISNNTLLKELYCENNELTSLDITANTALISLDCTDNYLDINNSPLLISSIEQILAREHGWARYEPQKIIPGISFNSDDVARLTNFALQYDNLPKLQWELSIPQGWLGVQWTMTDGEYRLRGLSISGLNLEGSLNLSSVPYLKTVYCSGNNLTSIDVSDCPMLSTVNCSDSGIIDLNIDRCPSLAVLNIAGNYLDIKTGTDLREIIDGLSGNDKIAVYTPQRIIANINDFNQNEYGTLSAFAAVGGNTDILGWNIEKPGEWQGITWEMIGTEYRVTGISMTYKSVTGSLDLSSFTELTDIDFAGAGISSVMLPGSIEIISDYTFYSCPELAQVILPGSLTRIGDYAFYNCESLRRISLPDSLLSIGERAFGSCSGLEKLTIPEGVEAIGYAALSDCGKLEYAMFKGDAPDDFGEHVFVNADARFVIYINIDADGWDSPEWNGYRTDTFRAPQTGLYGDVNGDGRVNGTDVQAMILWINAGKPGNWNIDEAAAKVTSITGSPDASDVQALVVWINRGGRAAIGHPGPW